MRNDQLAHALRGIVGWLRPVSDSCQEELPDSLTTSGSGLFVQDLNELMSYDVLRAVAPEGETVEDFLTRITADVTAKLVARVLTEQQLSGKVLMDAAPLLGGPGSLANTVNPLGRFVGFRLNLHDRDGVTIHVPRIGLQLDKALSVPLNIYVYSTAQDEPLQVLQVPYERAGRVQWFDVVTPEMEGAEQLDITFAGGEESVYIGYYEDDLPTGTHAIRRDFSHLPCQCPNDPFAGYNGYAWPRSISVPDSGQLPERALFFPESVALESQSFGLNLELTAYCDVARVLSSDDNAGRLAESLQLALGLRILEAVIVSPAITQFQQRPDIQADAMALKYEYQAKLYGGKEQGTDNYYPSLLKNIQFDLGGLDSACQASKPDRVSGTTLHPR